MRILSNRINIYLTLGLALLMTACASTKDKDGKSNKAVLNKKGKEKTFMRIFVQEDPDGTERTATVSIYRANPVKISVHKEPFLDEANLVKASVVDDIGGFAIKLEFNRQGTWLLENQTSISKGRQIVIAALFGDSIDKLRWLAAPYITEPNGTGVLRFTPDASREEADRIVLGLNNVVADIKKKSLFKDDDLK